VVNNLVAVIVPIYKETINETELVSLKQCLKILNNYPIIFIGPSSLNTQAYEDLCSDKVDFNITRFEDNYFNSIAGYNKLMLSPKFYNSFAKYKFILIYQLDAYVFKDELVYWCEQGYAYIGAPHIPHENNPGELQFLKGYSKFIKLFNTIFKTHHKISNVGNGGFSLRKTKACYLLLSILKTKTKSWGANNEDGFFKYWGNILYPAFRLPSDENALHFSIEESPKESLEQLGNKLPFGCHAFEKYDWETWQQFIK
jgi:hypothetical protein